MLLISNIADSIGVEYPKNAIIRINTAWVNTKSALELELKRLKHRQIYLDYPIGRTKPPKPRMDLSTILKFIHDYDNIKYFAWSNAEFASALEEIRNVLPKRVTLVPKIETLIGVLHLKQIILASKTNVVVIDKEDLATAAGNPELYTHFLEAAKKKIIECNAKPIEMKGVIFYG